MLRRPCARETRVFRWMRRCSSWSRVTGGRAARSCRRTSPTRRSTSLLRQFPGTPVSRRLPSNGFHGSRRPGPAARKSSSVLQTACRRWDGRKRRKRRSERGCRSRPSFRGRRTPNLGYYAAKRGDLVLAERRLQDGLAFFPRSRDLRLARARIAARAGHGEAAIAVLSGLLAERPADGDAALLLLDIEAPSLSPEQYRARSVEALQPHPGRVGPLHAASRCAYRRARLGGGFDRPPAARGRRRGHRAGPAAGERDDRGHAGRCRRSGGRLPPRGI